MAAADDTRIEFHFDFISHNAYLAWQVLPGMAARHGRALVAVPVLFAGLLEAWGQLGPAEIPPKLAWMNRNVLRKAAALGVALAAPFRHPFNPLLVLRVAAQAMDQATRAKVIAALFAGVWVEGIDAEDAEAVSQCLARHGLDGPALLAARDTPAVKAGLRANTDDAIARGVFGVPSMLVGGELFWGYDDLPLLDGHLAGRDPLAGRDVAAFEAAWADARTRGRHRER